MIWLVLIAVLCSTPSWAAITEVGGGSQRATKLAVANVDSTTLAYPGNVTSGNLLVCAGANWRSGGSSITVTDTRGTTYTVKENNPSNYTIWIAYGFAPSSGANTVTVDPTGVGNYPAFACDEFAGVYSVPLDVDGGFSTGTSAAPSDSLTTITPTALIIGVTNFSDTPFIETMTPGVNYTQIGEQEDNSSYTAFNAVFRIATTAQAYTVDWTLGNSRLWYAYTAAFVDAEQYIGCVLQEDGVGKILVEDLSGAMVLEGGSLAACMSTGKGFPFYNDPFYPMIVR